MPPQQTPQPTPNAQPQGTDLPAAAPMMPAPIQDGSPYFAGEHALVKFSTGEIGYGPETYWLVDKNTKTITPFLSPESLQAVFGPEFQAAMQGAVTVVPPNVASDGRVNGGVFDGFYVLGPEYAIQPDGSGKKLDFTPTQLAERYGRPIDENLEEEAMSRLEELFNKMKSQSSQLSFPPNYIDKLMRDHKLLAFYINAIAYGDYEETDVFLDILRRVKEIKKATSKG
jgi:hypothetical protein